MESIASVATGTDAGIKLPCQVGPSIDGGKVGVDVARSKI